MPKSPAKKQPKNIAADSHPNLEEEIRRCAYELYEERGRKNGHDLAPRRSRGRRQRRETGSLILKRDKHTEAPEIYLPGSSILVRA